MKKYFFILLVSCTLCGLLRPDIDPACAASHTPHEQTILDSGKASAATMLQAGDFAGAYESYMRLLREVPDDDEVNLGLARAATRYGRHNQAVMAYERLIEKYPREPRLYVEVANSYMALQDKTSAERAYEHARMLDPEITHEASVASLDKLGAQHSLLQIHGALRAGMLYDSNVNMGPESNNISLGNWNNVQLKDGKRKDSAGSYFSANLDLARRVERDSQWWLVGDIYTFLRGNFNGELENNHTRSSVWTRAAMGLRHTSSTTLLDLRVKAEIFDYEFLQNVIAAGPELAFLWAPLPNLHLISRANIEHREYSEEAQRRGPAFSAGQYARLYFGEANHSVMLGARYIGVQPERDAYRYDSLEALLRFDFKLPWGFELSPFVIYAAENYHGPATVLELESRYDNIWRVGTSLVYHINERWDIDVMYQYTSRSSNSELYDARQHLVQMGVAWNF